MAWTGSLFRILCFQCKICMSFLPFRYFWGNTEKVGSYRPISFFPKWHFRGVRRRMQFWQRVQLRQTVSSVQLLLQGKVTYFLSIHNTGVSNSSSEDRYFVSLHNQREFFFLQVFICLERAQMERMRFRYSENEAKTSCPFSLQFDVSDQFLKFLKFLVGFIFIHHQDTIWICILYDYPREKDHLFIYQLAFLY